MALTASALLVLTSCARSSDAPPEATGGKYGTGVDLKDLDDEKTPAASAKPRDGAVAGGARATPFTGGGPGSQIGSGPSEIRANLFADDNGATGRNAAHYLRGNPYTKLVVELTAAGGAEPPPAALDYLREQLEEVVDKPRGIDLLPLRTIRSSKARYGVEDFRALEKTHRKRFSGKTGGDIVLHVLFLNGRHERSEFILGEAWRASSIVIFSERIEDISDPIVTSTAIQRSILLHEAGHNLALLNWGHRTPRPHYMKDNPTHSNNEASVMSAAVERGDLLFSVFNGPPPDTFDADDEADLADIRSGKLRPYGI